MVLGRWNYGNFGPGGAGGSPEIRLYETLARRRCWNAFRPAALGSRTTLGESYRHDVAIQVLDTQGCNIDPLKWLRRLLVLFTLFKVTEFELGCRAGLAEQEPLRPGTTAGAYQRKLVIGFDSLSDRIDV